MKLDELSTKYSILPVVKDIVNQVRDLTGKDIDFRISNKISVYSTTKVARERMNEHVVFFKEDVSDRLSYVIAHECGHILRIMGAKQEDRVVPATNRDTKMRILDEFKDTSIPESMLPRMVSVWVDGLITQLTNLPVDVRIERWMQGSFPSLKEEQIKALDIDAQSTLKGLTREVKTHTPKKVYITSNSMAYAYLRSIGPITGKRYDKAFYDEPTALRLGKKLYNILDNEEDQGFTGDLKIINEWAKVLNIDSWFDWIDFESMPESYFKGV